MCINFSKDSCFIKIDKLKDTRIGENVNILIVSHEYPPHVTSGPGRYVTNLSKGLINKGHKVTIITPLIKEYGTNVKKYESNDHLTIYRLPLFQSKLLNKITKLTIHHQQ